MKRLSPFYLLAVVAFSAFLAEMLIMVGIRFLPPLSLLSSALIDATILVALISPTLYIFFFRPINRHITERKRAEDSLRLTQFSLDHSSDAIAWMGPDARFVYVNDSLCNSLGYTREELLSMTVHDIDPNFPKEAWPKHWEEIKQHKSFCFESIHRTKDGRIFPVEISINYLEFEGKEYNCAFARNITERKLAEEALRKSYEMLEKRVEERTAELAEANRELEEEITEHKRAEGALKDSEERFRKLFQNESDALMVFDAETLRFEDANRSTLDLFGYTKEEFLHLKVMDISAEQEKTKPALKKLKTGELEGKIIPRLMKKKDGSVFSAEISPGSFVSNKRKKFISAVRDVTERKLAEDALRESEAKYRDIVETSQDLIFKCDREGRFTYLNPAWETTLGYKSEEMLGRKFTDFKTSEQAEKDLKVFKNTFEGKEVLGYETVYISKSATPRNLVINIRLLKDGDGNVIGAQGTAHDITERKRAEEKLKFSEQNLHTIIGTVGEGIIVINDNSEIIMVNDELCRMFDYSKEELIGRSISMLMPKKHRAAHKAGMENYLKGAPPKIIGRRIEIEGLHKNSTVFPIELRIEKHSSNGGQSFFTGAIRDITERKKAEKELIEAKEEAENATVLKDKFVSLVSHDLRGPLGSIIGFIKLLHDGSFEPGKQKDIFNAIFESSENMNRLIVELLNISRLKTGKLKPESSLFDAKTLSIKALQEFDSQSKEKGIKLIDKVPAKNYIHADENLMYEVIRNLVANAVKFCKKGDSITISIPDGEPATIAVSDTGVGIASERLDAIFNYEEKTSTLGTAGEIGTGLGLPLSRDIMKAHGGKLVVESKDGQGTTFYAKLPDIK